MRRIWGLLKSYWFWFICLLGLVYAQVTANLSLPDYMSKIINQGILGKDNSLVLNTGGHMLLVSLGGAMAVVGVGFLASRIATGFARDLRRELFTKIESFSLVEFNSYSTASLITRSTNDIQQIQTVLVLLLRMALTAPLTGFEAIRKAATLAPSMNWIMWTAVAALLLMIVVLFGQAIPKFTKLQAMVDRLNLVTREFLTGLRVIRAFNTADREEQRFDDANRDLTKLNLFVNRLMVVMQPLMMLIMSVMVLAIVWLGAKQVDLGSLQIGDMMAFMQYAMQIIFAFLMVSIVFIMVPRASVSLRRVVEVLNTEPTIKDAPQTRRVRRGAGQVSFENVTFTYHGGEQPALHNISFTARPGQTTAIVGSTGSGKTTLINLIPRFYDVDSGAVKVDGVDIRELKQEDLYRKIGFVPQKATLFSGSVASNLRYGAGQVGDEEMRRIARVAQSRFVEKMADGYDSPIAQGGGNLSGGQKQRLSIARALMRQPEIYIFDDSFSALDFTTDAKLRRALVKETKGKTVIIVAQRISTIMNADKIIVLSEGRIVGEGTHRELLRDCDVYREIAASQLSAKELEEKS